MSKSMAWYDDSEAAMAKRYATKFGRGPGDDAELHAQELDIEAAMEERADEVAPRYLDNDGQYLDLGEQLHIVTCILMYREARQRATNPRW